MFCGSREPATPALAAAAEATAEALVAAGYDLVYGGTRSGLMGRIATRALALGAGVIGIVPTAFEDEGILQPGLTECIQVDSMHERKIRMVLESDVFVTLPGGYGTLDELFEVLTLAMLGAHAKPIGLLDAGGFYAPLLSWIEGAAREGFLTRANLDLLVVEREPEALVRRLAAHRPVPARPLIRLADA